MKILLATHNPAKIRDYSKILIENGIEIISLNDLKIKESAPEDAPTFEENAKSKALFYYNLAKIPTLADDGGFEIDYLNGDPGVKSRRWINGQEAADEEITEHLGKVIKTIPPDQRNARFTTVLCLVKSPEEIYSAKYSIEGYLTEDYNNSFPEGFPYRAYFIEKTFNKYVMDLTEEEYNQINHRRKNTNEILKHL